MKMKKTKFKTSCWIWPYAKNKDGYGQLQKDNMRYDAHKWLYELIKGKTPANCELDHLCGNKSCVNPNHLEAVSHKENCIRGNQTKLTAGQVKEIKALHGKMAQREIGAKYGVSHATIGYIFSGKRWA